jgi:hypothetical protein
MGAMYAALFHMIGQAGDKLGVQNDPLDGARLAGMFQTVVNTAVFKNKLLPLVGMAPALEVFLRLAPASAPEFKQTVELALTFVRRADPTNEEHAIKLAMALGTLPCGHLGCMTLPGPGQEVEQGLELPRGKLCSGCKAVRFCNSTCLQQAWKSSHRVACRALARQREEREAAGGST